MASAGSPRNSGPPDYYALLGLSQEASFREIEAAYWAQANRDENRARLALINEAYEVLGRSDQRAAYDAQYVPDAEPAQTSPSEAPRGNPGLANKLRWYLR